MSAASTPVGDHVACTVPDLDAAIAFFVDVLGWELAFRYERHPHPGSTRLGDRMHAHPGASFDLAGVRPTQGGWWVELFAYDAPDQRREIPRNSDLGGYHVALRVADVDALRVRLEAVPGGRVMGELLRVEEGPLAGTASLFYLTPWGLQLELVERPD